MAVALPPGWLDTAEQQTHTLSCQFSLRAQTIVSTPPDVLLQPGRDAVIGYGLFPDWSLFVRPAALATNLGCTFGQLGGMQSWSSMEAVLYHDAAGNGFDPANYISLGTAGGACVNPAYIGPFTATLTVGPLRLGVTAQAVGTPSVLTYAWFSDALTVESLVIEGTTLYTQSFADPPGLYGILGLGPYLKYYREPYGLSAFNGSSVYQQVKFENFQANGVSIAPGTQEYFAVFTTGPSHSFFFVPNEVGLPFVWKTDLDVDETSGAAVAADASYTVNVTVPATIDRKVDQYKPEADPGPHNYAYQNAGHAVLTNPWLGLQTVTPYALDQFFLLEGNDPKAPGNGTQSFYDVGTVEIVSPVAVLFSPNAWQIDIGTLVISGTSTSPTFTVTAGPWRVFRDLLSHWRDWNTAGPLNVPGESYTATKKNAYSNGADTPDTWGWGLYAYLDLTMNCSVPLTAALTIEWAVVLENNSIVTVERTYSPINFPSGVSTQRVDLLFPVEFGQPFYGERVDTIVLLGVETGTFSLTAVNLVAVEDGYFKMGGPVAKDQAGNVLIGQDGARAIGGITIAQDGAFAVCLWGRDSLILPPQDRDGDSLQDYLLDNQNGVLAYSATVGGILAVNHTGGAVGARRATIADVFAELNRMEGVNAIHSTAALDTALSDTFGNLLGIDVASLTAPINRTPLWLKPTLPHLRIPANTPATLTARLVFDDVALATGRTAVQQRIFQRNHLGAVIEAQGVDTSHLRGGAGATVTARRYFGVAPSGADPVFVTGTTDASGYVFLPHRTGRISGQEFGVYLVGN